MKLGNLKLKLMAIGMIAVPMQLSAQVEGEELLAANASWEYLLYTDASNVPMDPAVANANFHTTWHTPASYSGTPAFLTGTAMIGYGEVPNGAGNLIVTDMWAARDGMAVPPTGERYACYLRTSFTPTQEVSVLRFQAQIDDGAIIYLNGVELTRFNVPADPDAWTLLASGSNVEGEEEMFDVTLAAPLAAGVAVDLAVSLRSNSAGSSDMGFQTRLVSMVGEPAPNDDFASAEVLTGALPITVTGRSDNLLASSGASEEAGEPDHAGDAGGASVWYSWTPTSTSRVGIDTGGSSFDTVLGVYTGGSVGSLTEVDSNDDATFYRGSRVEFEAQAGTTYHIAVDGNGGAFGAVTLSVSSPTNQFEEDELLIAAGSSWDYLLGNNVVRAVDPDAQDPDGDFYSTWQTTADYDGPAFTNAPALLGYGVIDGDPVVTEIFQPASGDRNAVLYLRNSFTPAAAVTNLAFRGLVDDGAIIYIDGVEVARLNMNPLANPNSYLATALGSNHGGINNEAAPQTVIVALPLPAGVPVELAISVHNASATSSDSGFDMEVFSTSTPPPPAEGFTAFIAPTAAAGEYEVSWNSQAGALYDVEYSPDLQTWTVIATDVPGGATGTAFVNDTPADDEEGFYRVVRK